MENFASTINRFFVAASVLYENIFIAWYGNNLTSRIDSIFLANGATKWVIVNMDSKIHQYF